MSEFWIERSLFPTCPYCGHRHINFLLFKVKNVEYKCDSCRNSFWCTHETMNYFTTSKEKIVEKKDEGTKE